LLLLLLLLLYVWMGMHCWGGREAGGCHLLVEGPEDAISDCHHAAAA
jgi:hypothetical protein